MHIALAGTDDEIAACFPVMHELRPHLAAAEFLRRVKSQAAGGYALAAVWADGLPVAVAGFRVRENLAAGRFLYVDDLVTLQSQRSRGYGAALLGWLTRRARELGCAQLHLDSGMHRGDAHRFYEREGMTRAGYYFAMAVGADADESEGC